MDIDDIKLIVVFLILCMLAGFLWGYAIGNNKIYKEEFNVLSAMNVPVFYKTQLLGNLFMKDGKLFEPTQEIIYAYVSGYNTTKPQTDSTPCISASGDNICGRTNVVACPREIPLGTWIKIDGKSYQCLDRLHPKYDDRFDISFDKDIEAAKEWGVQYKEIIIFN
ncbi:MAG: hypothetical protein PHS93_09055 [Candidatus Omnitrophica bacterium]|nr:hypothetical protein [Candidatus Omnitrophota bacterium]MDD5551285.1 hypothetical protein [Candidatus Omnitrophota bacterium]